MNWPNDADGDVLRRMEAGGFDFARPHTIDFNVDFDDWPPPDDAMRALRKHFPRIEIYDPDEGLPGYVKLELQDIVTYELVMRTQAFVSRLMARYGGVCESWGVLH